MVRYWMLPALVGGLALAGCSTRQEGNDTAETTTTTTNSVTRQEIAAPAPSPTPVAASAIQTQPGPKGSQVSLNKAAVTGDILTVALTFTGGGDCCVRFDLDEVSLIDDATSQRISLLKDNADHYMAAPLDTRGEAVYLPDYQQASQVWFKFPAPPAGSKTVSLTIPGVAPFDAVPVTR